MYPYYQYRKFLDDLSGTSLQLPMVCPGAVLLVVVVSLLLYLWDRMSRRNFPPGPPRLPLLGNIPHLMLAGKHVLQVRFYPCEI
jgi:hypothetical protein